MSKEIDFSELVGHLLVSSEGDAIRSQTAAESERSRNGLWLLEALLESPVSARDGTQLDILCLGVTSIRPSR